MANYAQAKEYILKRLENELPTELSYHNVEHTLYVLEAVNQIAKYECIEGELLILLQTAALYHDAGFLTGMDDHEERSCAIVREVLPDFDYDAVQIDIICRMIIATNLKQGPTNLLEMIICDADLFHLGSDIASSASDRLLNEFLERGIIENANDWLKIEIDFITNHVYHTQTVGWLNRDTKKEYLESLNAKLEKQKSRLSA